MPETKTCPDCAETILAPARVCRYCGYRFDGPQPGATRSLLERLGVVRRRQPPSTLEQILADWGFATQPGEEVRRFALAVVDGQRGYVMVSDRRLMFAADLRRRQEPRLEYRLAGVQAGELARGGRRLTFRGAGWLHVVTGGGLRELAEAIAAPSPTPDEGA